jgi:hypothetical protein
VFLRSAGPIAVDPSGELGYLSSLANSVARGRACRFREERATVRRIRAWSRALLWASAIIALMSPAPGCGTVKMSGTARTGTEQLLLTCAWDSALSKVDFRALTGVPVFLDTTNVAAVDQGWVVSSLRQAMLAQGVLLRAKPEQAQWIVEARVGAYGTDSDNWMVGVQQTTIPPTLTGVPTGTIPEMSLLKKSNQEGVAKLALFAYDRSSGAITWSSGTMLAKASAKDLYLGPIGPIQSGSIRGGTEFIGVRIPGTAEPGADDSKKRRSPLRNSSMLALPPAATDIETFAP